MLYLIEFKNIEQLEKLAVLLIVLKLHVMLLKAVQGQFGLVVDIHFHRLLNFKIKP